MDKLKFKTSINCNGCKSAVKPFLDNYSRIINWTVDLESKDKILTVEGENIYPDEIVKLVTAAGYEIKEIK
jgi:copper chaperone